MGKTIKEYIEESHGTALKSGWWDSLDNLPTENNETENALSGLFFSEKLILTVGEISEAHEEYRKFGLDPEKFLYYKDTSEGKRKPEGIAAELADCLIRIFDYCGYYKIPLEEALEVKMEYNKNRPYKHGNKVC